MLAGQQFGLPVNLLESVCFVESSWRPNVIHKDDGNADSLGLCQIQEATARYMGFKGKKKDLMLPGVNAMYAAAYLNYQYQRYNKDPIKAIAAYNAGKYRVNAKGQVMNRKYVGKVLKEWGKRNEAAKH
jgi:soluble lytic murein transglycosylase-like protein